MPSGRPQCHSRSAGWSAPTGNCAEIAHPFRLQRSGGEVQQCGEQQEAEARIIAVIQNGLTMLKNRAQPARRGWRAGPRRCRHIRCGHRRSRVEAMRLSASISASRTMPEIWTHSSSLAQHHALFSAYQRGPVGRTSAMVTDIVRRDCSICAGITRSIERRCLAGIKDVGVEQANGPAAGGDDRNIAAALGLRSGAVLAAVVLFGQHRPSPDRPPARRAGP